MTFYTYAHFRESDRIKMGKPLLAPKHEKKVA